MTSVISGAKPLFDSIVIAGTTFGSRRRGWTWMLIWPPAVLLMARTVLWLTRQLKIGAGSTWPGEIALDLRPDFIRWMMNKNPNLKVVLVIGTNGKTTTVKLLTHILEQSGLRVATNFTGANLLNGMASTMISHSRLNGRMNYDIALIEIDENFFPVVAEEITPYAVVALNLFRDQLDRYGEIDTIVSRWERTFVRLPQKTKLILNGQDPNLFFLGRKLAGFNVHYFGLTGDRLAKKQTSNEADTIYCPNCRARLNFSRLAYAHLGQFSCPNCGTNEQTVSSSAKIGTTRLRGLFNDYNIAAASLAARVGFSVPDDEIKQAIRTFKPAFGRQERIRYRGRKVVIQLSKNPVGFNQSIELLQTSRAPSKNALIILNDNIPDGRDVSWIWDVDFEQLVVSADRLWLTGTRVYDLAIRLKYASVEAGVDFDKLKIYISDNVKKTLDEAVRSTDSGDKIFVFPVYSGMLEIRRYLVGESIRSS